MKFISELRSAFIEKSDLENAFAMAKYMRNNFDFFGIKTKPICIRHKSSSDFFIQKAIGWALREYAKTNPKAIQKFVAANNLKPLSRKEALKNLTYA